MTIETNDATLAPVVATTFATTYQPITIDDVRGVVGESDPNATNADRVRALLGRGSNATIQKHLNTLRAELVPPPVSHVVDAPSPPKELIAAVWSYAWQTAQAMSSSALANALERKEQAERERDVAAADRDSSQSGLDVAGEMLNRERVVSAQALQVAKEMLSSMEIERDAAKNELDVVMAAVGAAAVKAESDLNDVKKETALAAERAAAAAALAAAQHAAVQEAMRSEVDRLVNQLADLRSAFKTVAPTATTTTGEQNA